MLCHKILNITVLTILYISEYKHCFKIIIITLKCFPNNFVVRISCILNLYISIIICIIFFYLDNSISLKFVWGWYYYKRSLCEGIIIRSLLRVILSYKKFVWGVLL